MAWSESEARRLADAVRARECILFLGAGVHAPPPAGSAFEYPPRAAAADRLGAQPGARRSCDSRAVPREDPAKPPARRARLRDRVLARAGSSRRSATRSQVGKQPSPMLRALAGLDFPLVITTNYDQLFESALRAAGKEPRVAVYTPRIEATVDYRKPTAREPGRLQDPRRHLASRDDRHHRRGLHPVRLADERQGAVRPVAAALKVYLTDWTTLFVGYSLLDYNLRLLFKTLRWKIDSANVPDMYSVDFTPDPLIVDVWQNQRRYVKFIAAGRLGVRARAVRARARGGAGAVAVVARACRRRSRRPIAGSSRSATSTTRSSSRARRRRSSSRASSRSIAASCSTAPPATASPR